MYTTRARRQQRQGLGDWFTDMIASVNAKINALAGKANAQPSTTPNFNTGAAAGNATAAGMAAISPGETALHATLPTFLTNPLVWVAAAGAGYWFFIRKKK